MTRRPGVSAEDYKSVMRRWPSGVTIVTLQHDGMPHGLTASAFTSVSVGPPLVLVVIDKGGRSRDWILESGAYCVHLLAEDQSLLSDRFAGRLAGHEDRFAGLEARPGVTGVPVLGDAMAYLECEVEAAHEAGDHTIFVGRVVACGVRADDRRPLVYHNTRYTGLLRASDG